MNAALLLEQYARIADAADAIARLRRFVLELAVRGKLVEQDAGDEPAAELLKRIAAENLETRVRGLDKALRTKHEDLPFAPPRHWGWAKLVAFSEASYGFAFPSNRFNLAKVGMPLIRIRDISSTDTEAYFDGEYDPWYVVKNGDYLVGMDGDFNLRRWRGGDALLNQRVLRLNGWRCGIEPKFVRLPLQMTLDHLHGGTSQTTVKHLSAKQVNGIEIPLPPLAEQHRIVAKVDELMALCDQLEAARAEREAARERFSVSTLAKLNTPDPETFGQDARFALANLAPLTTRPDQIKQVRGSILNLAARGKLLGQNAGDEPASELFQQILRRRQDYAAQRKIRGDKIPSSPDVHVGLPECWVVAALGQIAVVTDPNPSHRYPSYDGGTVPLLSTREFHGDHGWAPETAQLTTEDFWQFQQELCDFAPGDIIFARKGRLGLPRYLPNLERFTFSHTLFLVKPMRGVLPDYLLLQLRRDQTVKWLVREMNQNTGVPTLGKAKMERLPIALPPLAEQGRIVAEVDKLMGLCDQLRTSITMREQTRSLLLEAVLNEALELG